MPVFGRTFIAICRECVGGNPEPTECWACSGEPWSIVECEDDADLVLEQVVHVGHGIEFSLESRWTDRFLSWLREIGGD